MLSLYGNDSSSSSHLTRVDRKCGRWCSTRVLAVVAMEMRDTDVLKKISVGQRNAASACRPATAGHASSKSQLLWHRERESLCAAGNWCESLCPAVRSSDLYICSYTDKYDVVLGANKRISSTGQVVLEVCIGSNAMLYESWI